MVDWCSAWTNMEMMEVLIFLPIASSWYVLLRHALFNDAAAADDDAWRFWWWSSSRLDDVIIVLQIIVERVCCGACLVCVCVCMCLWGEGWRCSFSVDVFELRRFCQFFQRTFSQSENNNKNNKRSFRSCCLALFVY